MHYDPIAEGGGRGGGGRWARCRTAPTRAVNSPWAPPGAYTVRLTVDGKSYTQPITLRLDPRVKTPALALAQLAALTTEMYDGAKNVRGARTMRARALVGRARPGAGRATRRRSRRRSTRSHRRPPAGGRGGRGGRGGGGGGRGGGRAAGAADAREREHGDERGRDGDAGRRRRADGESGGGVRARRGAQGRRCSRSGGRSVRRGSAALNAKLKASGQPAVKTAGVSTRVKVDVGRLHGVRISPARARRRARGPGRFSHRVQPTNRNR